MSKTHIGEAIEVSSHMMQYDAQVKRVLSNKWILAWLLKATAEEVHDMTIEQIVGCIGDKIDISKQGVKSGEINHEEAILGDNTESKIPGEGLLTYDIRFHIWLSQSNNDSTHEKSEIKLLINVEAQKDFYKAYDFATRGIVYGARMISSQLDTEIIHSNYQQLKKVYSIWICMNAPRYIGNALTKYYIEKKDMIGTTPDNYAAYDKLSVMLLYLNEKKDACNTDIFHLLNVLLSQKKEIKEKEYILQNKFGIKMSYDYEKELSEMCNLSEEVLRQGIEQGIERGIERGIEQGVQRAIIQLLKNVESPIPSRIEEMIINQTDDDILYRWLNVAAKAETIEEFTKKCM